MRFAILWPDEPYDVIDKPKHRRCLADEIRSVNIVPRERREARQRHCTACGKSTTSTTKLCTRASCAKERGEA